MSISNPFLSEYKSPTNLSNPKTVVTTKGTGVNRIGKSQTLVSMVTSDDEADLQTYTIEPIGRQRTQITLTYDKKDFTSLRLKSYENQNEKSTFYFPNSNSVSELKKFLNTVWEINIDELNSGKLVLANINNSEIFLNILDNVNLTSIDKLKLKTLINKLIIENDISENDLDIITIRKKSIKEFEELLSDTESYKSRYEIKDPKEEKIWQHFFEKNTWIFGLSLDYQFNKILDPEHTVGLGNVDFLCGNKFTVLVEIKTPRTNIYKDKNRSDAWGISTDISDAKSQILQYKAKWQINSNDSRNNKDKEGNNIKQATIDPKCILLIGNFRSELEGFKNDKVREIAQETFEMFRRDSRNVEIITFDELLDRAKYIINKQ